MNQLQKARHCPVLALLNRSHSIQGMIWPMRVVLKHQPSEPTVRADRTVPSKLVKAVTSHGDGQYIFQYRSDLWS